MDARSIVKTTVICVVGIAASVALFFAARHTLLAPFQAKIGADLSVRSRLIQQQLEKTLLAAEVLQQRMRDRTTFDAAAFRAAAAALLAEDDGIGALVWAPMVTWQERKPFETQGARTAGADFRIRDGGATGNPVPAADRDAYFPVLFVEGPWTTGAPAVGLDLAHDPQLRAAVARARDSERVSVAVFNSAAQPRAGVVAVLQPVFADAGPVGAAGAGSVPVKGIVGAVLDSDRLVRAALKPTRAIGLPFDLSVIDAGDERRLVYHWTARLPPARSWKSVLLTKTPTHFQRFTFAGRDWEVRAAPNSAYLEQNQPLGHWILLASGLFLTLLTTGGFFQAFSQQQHLRVLNGALQSEIAARQGAEVELKRSLGELQRALASVKTLEGILPICASCKKIRDERGSWTRIESYVSKRTTAEFSHGLCPECAKRLYPGLEFEPSADAAGRDERG